MSLPELIPPVTRTTPETVPEARSRLLGLRIASWAVLLSLGAVQAWVIRFSMNPDGISYLDMGDAYWRGDWHNAISAYWSPLYSWILGFFLQVLKPTPYWEYPVVHLANFLIYVATLACFDFFLATFLAARQRRESEVPGDGQSGLTESSWWLLGYSLFAGSSLMLIGLYRVCPDLCTAALVYLASALIVRIRTGTAGRATYVVLGVVLGLAYLAKAVMFPLAFVFLAVAISPKASIRKCLQNMAIAAVVFLAVAAPLCAAISSQTGRLTFGESGSWNYAVYVNHVAYWAVDSPSLKHPLRLLSASPPVYEFAQPVAGTFPPWYDPTYWHDGIKPHVRIRQALKPIAQGADVYAAIFFLFFLNASAGVCVLYFVGGSIGKSIGCAAQHWAIAIPAIAPLVLYSLVHAEGRFIGASVTILYLVVYAGVLQAPTRRRARLTRLTVAAVAAGSVFMVIFAPTYDWPVSKTVYAYPRPVPGSVYAEAALALQRGGVQTNDRIGLVMNWSTGAAEGAYVARLLRAKIVAEETDADAFWRLDPVTRRNAIEMLKGTGIRAILASQIPVSEQEGWSRLGNTEYFALFFPKGGD